MRIGQVIGHATLSKCHPSLIGSRWLLTVPCQLGNNGTLRKDAEEVVVFDELGANVGALIGFCEGPEASAPFLPAKKPLDAYCSCLIDQLAIINDEPGNQKSFK